MVKKDKLSSIIEIRNRGYAARRELAAFNVMNANIIYKKFKNFSEFDKLAFANFFPVTIVTSMEVFFRLAIAEIIDQGSPYVERSTNIARNVKFDLELIQALQGRQITLGEVIGHSVSLNNVASINATMTTLIGEDFLKRLSGTRDRWAIEVQGKPNEPVIKDIDAVCRNIQRVLEVRHIVVHEIPHRPPFSIEDVEFFIKQTRTFLHATDCLIWDMLEPDAPLTQADMTMTAHKQCEDANEKLCEVRDSLRSKLDSERIPDLEKAQSAWEKFRDAEAEFHAKEFEGGSIKPMIHAMQLKELTRNRTEDFQKLIRAIEEELP